MQTQNIHRAPTSDDRALAVEQLQKFIDTGTSRAKATIEQVMSQVPTDRVANAEALSFEADHDSGIVRLNITPRPRSEQDRSKYQPEQAGDFSALLNRPHGSGIDTSLLTGSVKSEAVRFGLHNNAVQQVAGRLDIPKRFVDDLNANHDWGRELLVHNLNTLLQRRFAGTRKRFLTREVNGQVRAFLSDSYRRIDSRPVLDAIIGACEQNGAVICDGYAGETKVHVKAILPHIVEVLPGEFVVFGFGWSNSDFGKGANELYSFIERLWCLNGAHLSVEMRNVHLGSRLSDNVEYSDRTLALDTEAMAAVVKDTTKHLLSAGRIDQLAGQLRTAASEDLDPKHAVANLRKLLTKTETDEAVRAFNSPDVVNLPAGQNKWRLSNAVSWLANQTEDAERALELQQVAGDIIRKAA